MDFDTSYIDREVELQNKVDPEGQGQTETTWGQQFSNAYNQSKLVDYWGSEQNQYFTAVDDTLKDMDLDDKTKEDIKFYKERIMPYEDDMLKNMFDDGDWSYDYDNDTIKYNNLKALELRNLTDAEIKMKGYALSHHYKELDDKTLRNKAKNDTRTKYLAYEEELQKDDFFDNFGSQLAGNVGAYLTDPIGAATLAAEIATLGALKPLTFSLQAAKGAERARKVKTYLEGLVKQLPPDSKYLKEAKTGKTALDMTSKRIFDISRDKVIKTALAEGGIAGGSEAIQQYLTYDFKNSVLPEYTPYQRDAQIGLVGTAAGLLTFAGGVASQSLWKETLDVINQEGMVAKETIDDMFKREDVLPDETPLREEMDISKIDDVEALETRKQQIDSALDELHQCFINK
jgi:hypothetical protein